MASLGTTLEEPLLFKGGSQPRVHIGITYGTSKNFLYLGLTSHILDFIGLGFSLSTERPPSFWLKVGNHSIQEDNCGG